MDSYARILLVAIPAFVILVILEKWYGVSRGSDSLRLNDTISSLSSGITNVTKDVLGLSVAIISYAWLEKRVALTQVPSGWVTYVIAFIALDFAGYWVHRISHEINFFWNNHIVHHSSEEFNLACALRQSISSFVRIFTVFLLPAALLGVPPEVIAVVAPLHLFAQFWYHTRHIGRMGILEHIIVTPSHHRVHHAINPEYLDKNYGQIFILWDKWFGTFREESPEVPCVYGVTRPVRTWNPIRINFMHVWLLIRDAWRASRWQDKFRIWFMPLGWRPADVAGRYPLFKIEDVYVYRRYDAGAHPALAWWSLFQLVTTVAMVFWLFANISAIGSPAIFWYGGFVFLSVHALTELLDERPMAWVWESVRLVYATFLAFSFSGEFLSPGWFGLERFVPSAGWLVPSYMVLATVIAFLWCRRFRAI